MDRSHHWKPETEGNCRPISQAVWGSHSGITPSYLSLVLKIHKSFPYFYRAWNWIESCLLSRSSSDRAISLTSIKSNSDHGFVQPGHCSGFYGDGKQWGFLKIPWRGGLGSRYSKECGDSNGKHSNSCGHHNSCNTYRNLWAVSGAAMIDPQNGHVMSSLHSRLHRQQLGQCWDLYAPVCSPLQWLYPLWSMDC